MEYELALKLKKSGFPQKGPVGFWLMEDGKVLENGVDAFVVMNHVKEQFSKPTLRELIDACGDGFSSLSRKKGGWLAYGSPRVNEGIAFLEEWYGSTPEIAVANLYLALHPVKE